jgi:Asp-tRNA(Asn)/Glu-tRNA(Gln) amidotransferase A subunit family amidase
MQNHATDSVSQSPISRRLVLKSLGALGIGSLAFQRALTATLLAADGDITADMIKQAEWIADIELDDSERESVAESIQGNLAAGRRLRAIPVDADTVPALVFRPDFFYDQAKAAKPQPEAPKFVHVYWSVDSSASRKNLTDEDLAFASVSEQASLLRTKQVSSRELTQVYLDRLKKYDPLLKCVITLLEEHALESANAADERHRSGRSRGVLDGIPWVAKDLIAIPPWKTTWGAVPFKDQVRNETATVATRLSDAGAVLLAKVSLGALAWGDEWFDGMTRNPWNPEQGSSGSSAGSASAVAAGLATFALGSETLGSIVSPTRRCRTSGLRPTFGRVSRAGCMPLAWSFDKIGPIARHAEDLALVFPALLGRDHRDPTLVDKPYQWSGSHGTSARKLSELRIGVTKERMNALETQALEFLKSEGATIVDMDWSSELPVGAMSFLLGTEAASVFEDAFRADRKADYGMWPSTFREAPFTPAMQYIRANRLRGQLVTETERKLATVDAVLGSNDLLLTNLTGHPSLVVACGSDKAGDIELPGVVKLTASAYQESMLLEIGVALQQALPTKPSRPPLDKWL